MPSDTRQKSDKGDENIVINFLRGSEFGELIKSIVTKVINKEMKTIHDRINQLELKIDNLVKLTPTTIEENPKSAKVKLTPTTIEENPKSAKGNGNIKSNTTKTTDSRPTEFSYSNAEPTRNLSLGFWILYPFDIVPNNSIIYSTQWLPNTATNRSFYLM
ncbi:hypothetical protein QE152_g13412 [Popillia japonica]|uniref:Uncharacterized protein n=1 Tax=Popillia japonica TaxID=7064 RepID=A0AAW1LCS4_POPJA